jgi:hypothetical protein
MRIPASKLIDCLEIGKDLPLRTHDFRGANPALPYLEIVSMACRGLIEGIATSSGKVRLLRILRDDEREEIQRTQAELIDSGKSTAFAVTRMGVFREALREAVVVSDPWGNRTVRSAGQITGYTFTHYEQPQKEQVNA